MAVFQNSHQNQLTLAVAAALALTGTGVASHAAPATPDAFMPVPATSVAAIVAQVQTNAVVRQRYARQLHVPESRVASYLQANLVKSHLGQSARYTMYCVRPNGLVYPALLTLPKGSTVFALRHGAPVISCPEGNPLARFRPVVITRIVASRTPRAVVSVSPSQEMIAPVQGREIIVPAYVPTPVYQSVPSLTPAEQGTTPAAAQP